MDTIKEFKVYHEADELTEAFEPKTGSVYRDPKGNRVKCIGRDEYEILSVSPFEEGVFLIDLSPRMWKQFLKIERKAGRYGN